MKDGLTIIIPHDFKEPILIANDKLRPDEYYSTGETAIVRILRVALNERLNRLNQSQIGAKVT
jgi:hypothetical protein